MYTAAAGVDLPPLSLWADATEVLTKALVRAMSWLPEAKFSRPGEECFLKMKMENGERAGFSGMLCLRGICCWQSTMWTPEPGAAADLRSHHPHPGHSAGAH